MQSSVKDCKYTSNSFSKSRNEDFFKLNLRVVWYKWTAQTYDSESEVKTTDQPSKTKLVSQTPEVSQLPVMAMSYNLIL